MSREDLLAHAMFTQNRDPGLIFWSLRTFNNRVPPGAPPLRTGERLTWCTCGNCQEMNTDVENICCGQDPQWCISTLPHMNVYILQEGAVHIAVQIWNDVRAQTVALVTKPGRAQQTVPSRGLPQLCYVEVWAIGIWA